MNIFERKVSSGLWILLVPLVSEVDFSTKFLRKLGSVRCLIPIFVKISRQPDRQLKIKSRRNLNLRFSSDLQLLKSLVLTDLYLRFLSDFSGVARDVIYFVTDVTDIRRSTV